MATLYQTPSLDLEDQQVIDEVAGMRTDLARTMRTPRRWTGGLRRTAQARAIQGSNSVEGYLSSGDLGVPAGTHLRALDGG